MNTTKHILILLALMALSTAAWAQGLSGTGTSTDPYLITSVDDWNTFAQSVTDGTTYAGQFVKLEDNIINVTSMAGTEGKCFSGTFDGDGHTITLALSGSGQGTALFSDLKDATLKNLKAQGSVATTGYRPATFAAFVEGNSTISNCLSTVDVSSTRSSGWVDGGGFVGRVHANDTLNMTGCAFHGSVTFTNGATTGGGMVGYTQSDATVSLTNCLYSPSALTLNVNAYNPRIFVCGEEAGNLTNCYYNDVAAASVLENEGKQAYSITGINGANVDFRHSQATIYNVSSIIAYSVGMAFAGTYYAGETETVSLRLTHDNHPGYIYGDGYIASAGTLNGTGDLYTLTMPNEDVTIAPNITAYTVSVQPNPNIAGAAQVSLDNTNWSSSVSAAVGDVVYCKTNNVIGYTSHGYTIETEFDGSVSLTDGHFTMPAANVTYYVVFSPSSAYIDYTVILSPGEGTGAPIVYPFEPATAALNAATAENLQFYYVNYNTIGFRLPYDYCPSSFTVPNGVYFIGWDGWSNNGYITLTSTETTFTAQWGNPMPPLTPSTYIDGNGEYHTCNNYTVLTGGQGETTLEGGWYVVDSDITYSNDNGFPALTLNGDVTLILCNGKTMTVTSDDYGIRGNSHSLTLYGQSLDPNVAGTLNVNSTGSYSAIAYLTTYTQHSGKVIVSSPGEAIRTKGFTLNGGSLEASGKNCGISTWDGGDLTINGGTVTANSTQTDVGFAGLSGSGNVVINGGKVEANKIFAEYNITLGYTQADDYIKSDNFYYAYSGSGTVSVKSGQFLYYKNGVIDVTVSGNIANPNSTIAGKTLRPYIIPITVTKEIAGYGSGNGGWHLIASPLQGNNYVEYVNGLISNTASHYDLYRFNQDANKEWENYKANSPTNHPDFITLRNGRGYLYAHSTDTTLTFIGVPYSGNGEVDLTYSEANPDENMHGWNLVGNPFGTAANLPSELSYYTLNGDRTELTPGTASTIEAMEAIFVKATATGQSVTFTQATRDTKASPQESQRIVLDLSHSGAVIDRAIVRFDDGQTLPKFQIRDNSTKIYIPQEGEDYAVVSVGRDAPWHVSAMPVQFKAAENGIYTINVNVENVDLDYLHLIDNMTGADVDLLVTNGGDARPCVSTYTFTAKTTDYESRFKLVFAASGDTDGGNDVPFAFISNGNIIINGEGTLQVIDILGRELVRKELATLNSKLSTLNYTPGVYILRLINGEDVRVQKIVVE